MYFNMHAIEEKRKRHATKNCRDTGEACGKDAIQRTTLLTTNVL